MLKGLGRILASASAPGIWPLVVLESGMSINGKNYPEPNLVSIAERRVCEARPLASYEKIDAHGNRIVDHVAEDFVGLGVRNVVGVLRNTRWSEAEKAIVGEAHLSLGKPEADALEADLQAHAANGNLDAFGVSIDAYAVLDPDGVTVRDIESLVELTIVTHPSAGGRFAAHRIAASVQGVTMFDKILKFLRESFPALLGVYAGPANDVHLGAHIARRCAESADARGDLVSAFTAFGKRTPQLALRVGDTGRITEGMDYSGMLSEAALIINIVREDIESATAAALAAGEAQAGAVDAAAAAAVVPVAPVADAIVESATARAARERREQNDADLERIATAARVRESHQHIRDACTAATLGDSVADSIIAEHPTDVLTREAADVLAQSRRRLIDQHVREAAGRPATIIREGAAKLTDALAHLLSPRCPAPAEGAYEQHSFMRFLENHLLGNARISESLTDQPSRRRLYEAIDSTNFDQVYADALNRALLAEYRGLDYLMAWRQLVTARPVSDFRSYKTIRLGFYGELPTVDKLAPYTLLTTPTDVQETITLAKKGGIETIAMEDVLNDDLGLLQTMLKRLARAAAETRYETIFDLIRIATQPTMTDSNALTSAGRSPANLLTTALTNNATGVTAWITAAQQMMKATGGSGKRKGVVPRFIIHPIELMEAVNGLLEKLVGGKTGTDVDEFAKRYGFAAPQPVLDMTTTNATDWFNLADPAAAPVFEYATLNGREDPEIFVADDNRFGALFTNDILEHKIRDIFAFAATDTVGIQGNDVA